MLTRYPERFGALFCTIPLVDMRRYSKLLAGPSWIAEYGDPEKPDDWAFLKTYSAYHLAVPGGSYPPILLATTRKDDRVHPGHARKMAAKLQALGYEAHFYEPAAGGHSYGKDNKETAAFVAPACVPEREDRLVGRWRLSSAVDDNAGLAPQGAHSRHAERYLHPITPAQHYCVSLAGHDGSSCDHRRHPRRPTYLGPPLLAKLDRGNEADNSVRAIAGGSFIDSSAVARDPFAPTAYTASQSRRHGARPALAPVKARAMPAVFCLTENFDECAAFLADLRTRLNVPIAGRRFPSKRGAVQQIGRYIAFETMRKITPSAALVLASEYDRVRRLRGIDLWLVNVDKWNPDVFQVLFDLGFFDVLESLRRLSVKRLPTSRSSASDRVKRMTPTKSEICSMDWARSSNS